MGVERGEQFQLNSAETSLLEFFEANLSETEMNNFRASLLMNDEQRMARTLDLMERLELYKVDPIKASPRVQKAWRILSDFSVGKSQFFQDNGLTFIVYGSTTFDDPATLDFDICVLGLREDEEIENVIEKDWVRELSPVWREIRPGNPVNIGIEGHAEYMSYAKLEGYVRALKEDRKEFVDEKDLAMFVFFSEGVAVLAGNYLYSSKEDESELKDKYLEIVRQSPLLFAYVIWNLEQSLIYRETRRAGVADHQTGEDKYTRRSFGLE
jgi:hypothetical protein